MKCLILRCSANGYGGCLQSENCLWKKILSAKYGNLENIHRRNDTSRLSVNNSQWLNDLLKCINSNENWFSQSTERVVGNGSSTFFSTDVWLDLQSISNSTADYL